MSRAQLAMASALFAITGCVSTASTPCGDTGLICARGHICVTLDVPDAMACVLPEAVAACRNLTALALCTLPGEVMPTKRRCYEGVCLPVGCGNGRVDRLDDEICDDANSIIGDGCSANCTSDETCGNGIVDPIVADGPSEECDDGNTLSFDGCAQDCRREVPNWTRLRLGRPSPRSSPAMANASRRERVVMFGGVPAAGPSLLGDTWEWDGRGWQELTPSVAPAPRSSAAMAYDWRRDRVVMFGGAVGPDEPTDETWTWDGAHWEAAQVTTAPPPRSGAVMAYDAKRGVTVLYGGVRRSPIPMTLSDTWEWDGIAWAEVIAASPPGPQLGHAMAFDPKRGVVVLVGTDAGGTQTTTWDYNGTWTERPSTPRPPPRNWPTLTYDLASQSMIMFGGMNTVWLNDTWSWNGSAWTALAPTVVPPARTGHVAATDNARGSIVMFGGTNDVTSFDDTFTWGGTPGTWTDAGPTLPAPRAGHAAVHDVLRGRVVMVGDQSLPAETWEFESSWRPGADGPTPVREHQAMAFDVARGRVVMFGGNTPNGATAETWTLDGATWTSIATAVAPSRRSNAAMVYDARGREVVLYGGLAISGSSAASDETWIWDGATWAERIPVNRPPPRLDHSLAYDPVREQVVMFGGYEPLDDVPRSTWLWDGSTWNRAMSPTQPLPRRQAGMVWNPARRRILLFGGARPGTSSYNDTWEWDGIRWDRVTTEVAPPIRSDHVLVASPDGTGVLVYGGFDAQNVKYDDVWLLRWSTPDATGERCYAGYDTDLDDLVGCADPSCWAVCTPTCSPDPTCLAEGPRCGDNACNPDLETCRSCPADCGVCPATCGDQHCDLPENLMTCPGDCAFP